MNSEEPYTESVENTLVGSTYWYELKEILYNFALDEVHRGSYFGNHYVNLLARWNERDEERKKKLEWIKDD